MEKDILISRKIDFSKIKEQENKKVVVERLAHQFEDCRSKFSSLREKASLTCSQVLPSNNIEATDDEGEDGTRERARQKLKELYLGAYGCISECRELRDAFDTQCDYKIGCVVSELVTKAIPLENIADERSTIHHGSAHVVKNLADTCKKQRCEEILRILNLCDCQKCTILKQKWVGSSDDLDTLPYASGEACLPTEIDMSVASMKCTNVCKTTLHRLADIAKTYPQDSAFALGICGIPRNVLHAGALPLCNSLPIGARVPLFTRFEIPGGLDALSSIHFVDGDSGYIVLDHFPGLKEKYSNFSKEVKIGESNLVTELWIPFRESYHDAIEISHQYTVEKNGVKTKHDLGLEGFWKAMDLIHSSERLAIIVNNDDAIVRGDENARLGVSIFIRKQTGSAWEPFALEMLKSGLSFLTHIEKNRVSSDYRQAEKFAFDNKRGLYGIMPPELLVDSWNDDPKKDFPEKLRCSLNDLMPWKMRNEDLNSPLTVAYNESTSMKVGKEPSNVHQCMVFIRKSTITGAGHGLFLRPSSRPMFFPKDTILCWYANRPLTDEECENMPNTDYTLEVSMRGSIVKVDASVFNGYNVGRFANQGGLFAGLKCLAEELRDYGRDCRSAEDTASRSCQLTFAKGKTPQTKNHVCLMVSVDRLDVGRDVAKELFVHYSLSGYWLNYLTGLDICNGMQENEPDTLISLARWIVAENARKDFLLPFKYCAYTSDQVHQLKQSCICPPIELDSSGRARKARRH